MRPALIAQLQLPKANLVGQERLGFKQRKVNLRLEAYLFERFAFRRHAPFLPLLAHFVNKALTILEW